MKKFVMLCVLFALLTVVNQVRAQDAGTGRPTCCSNALHYARSIPIVLKALCDKDLYSDELTENTIKVFIAEVQKTQEPRPSVLVPYTTDKPCENGQGNIDLTNKSRDAVHIDPRLCFSPTDLLKMYSDAISPNLEKCRANIVTLVHDGDAGVTVQLNHLIGNLVINERACNVEGACPVTTENSSYEDNIYVDITAQSDDDAGAGNGAKEDAEPPVPQQIPPMPPMVLPTDPVITTASGSVQLPSDMRTMALQMPVSMNDHGANAAVGIKIKPYYTRMASEGRLINEGRPGWSLEKALTIGFGASQTPTWIDPSSTAKEAVALAIDVFNSHDPLLNNNVMRCISEGTKKLVNERISIKEKKGENVVDNDKIPTSREVRTATTNCLENTFGFTIGSVFASGDTLRPTLVLEWSVSPNYGLAAFGSFWVKEDSAYPIEFGLQGYSNFGILSGHFDSSAMYALSYDGEKKWRGSFGAGSTVQFSDSLVMDLSFRMTPQSYEPGGPDLDWHFVATVGYAGLDVTTSYINGRINTEYELKTPKPKPVVQRPKP